MGPQYKRLVKKNISVDLHLKNIHNEIPKYSEIKNL